MKTFFKIMAFIQIIGWFPFMFICAFSVRYNWSTETNLLVTGLGFILCTLGSLSIIVLGNNFWRNQPELDELKTKYEKAIKNYDEAKDKLIEHVLKQK